MRIEWKSPAGRDEVLTRIAEATQRRRTLQRDRLRVVPLAGEGDEGGSGTVPRANRRTRRTFASVRRRVGRPLSQRRARRDRREEAAGQGAEALEGAGRVAQETARRGCPKPEDKVCTFRGRDIRRIVEVEFGAVYTANGIYDVLERLDYSSLKPRPRHRENDPQKAAEFVRDAPLLPGM